jgi:hypothetical protein
MKQRFTRLLLELSQDNDSRPSKGSTYIYNVITLIFKVRAMIR